MLIGWTTLFLVDASLNRPTTARARHGKRRGMRLIVAGRDVHGRPPHPAGSPSQRGGLSKARAPRPSSCCLRSLPSRSRVARVTQAGVALDQLVAFVARRSRGSSATHALCHIPENCTWICCRHPLNKGQLLHLRRGSPMDLVYRPPAIASSLGGAGLQDQPKLSGQNAFLLP